jgi:hypothetical protein
MRSTTLIVSLLAALALVGASAAGCGGDDSAPTAAEFEENVVTTRDRVDFALARIPNATSMEEYLTRMSEASVAIEGAATDFEDGGLAEGWEPEGKRFASALHQLSVDLDATASDLQNPALGGITSGLQGFNFESWDKANLALATMIGKGMQVEIIGQYQ